MACKRGIHFLQRINKMSGNNEVDIESIIGFDALYDSMCKCRKGVVWKDSVASFYLRGVERIIYLEKDLHNGGYKPKPPIHFKIMYPKPRDIASIAFRDRVYQRSLNDNAVYPIMTKSFIYDNYACQQGKGTDAARNRLKDFLRKYYRRYGSCGYVAQFDIHGYYPNMDHEITESMFRKKLPNDVYMRVEKILHEQYSGDKGYNPGSQLIQIAGISYLDGLDHYIKEKLHVKYYLRYMDDLILIHQDKAFLERCYAEIENYLSQIKAELNPVKSKIYKLSDGIVFMGFIFNLSNTGKVYMHINPKNVKAQRKKLKRLVARSKKGLIPKDKVTESYMAWRNHAEKGTNHKLLLRMDKYYKELWMEVPK